VKSAGIEHQAFYEIAATVIPVLFFALLFQLDWFKKGDGAPEPPFDLMNIAIILFAFLAEVICVVALAEGRTPSDAEKIVVSLAIPALFLPAILMAALPLFRGLARVWPWAPLLGRVFVLLWPIAVGVAAIAHVRLLPILAFGALFFFMAAGFGSAVYSDYRDGKLTRRSKE
jgi:hypothetical protein